MLFGLKRTHSKQPENAGGTQTFSLHRVWAIVFAVQNARTVTDGANIDKTAPAHPLANAHDARCCSAHRQTKFHNLSSPRRSNKRPSETCRWRPSTRDKQSIEQSGFAASRPLGAVFRILESPFSQNGTFGKGPICFWFGTPWFSPTQTGNSHQTRR